MKTIQKQKILAARRKAGDRFLDWFVRDLSPKYARPVHLMPLIEVLEDIANGGVHQVVVHTPPRHGKTETLLHFIAWFLKRHPSKTAGYASYGAHIANSKSRTAMALAERAGVKLETRKVTEWRTTEGGGCLATSVGGVVTGFGLDLAIIDDAIKNRVDAESAHKRQVTWEWFQSTWATRLEPGASSIINMTRWHEHDLAGMAIKELGWRYIKLPAIDDSGRALWPSRWPADALEKRRETVGEYVWASLYQGDPKPRGGSVFGDPVGCELDANGRDVVPSGLRIAIGIDCAYSQSTASDYSAIVVMGEADGRFFVLEVQRVQMRAPDFAVLLADIRKRHYFAPVRWYAAGPEKGVGDFLTDASGGSAPVVALAPKGDKFIRAIGYAAAWNAGRIRLPNNSDKCPWLDAFVVEHGAFTGVKDVHDDMIDAAVAAFDELSEGMQSFYPEKPDGVSFGRRL